MIMENMENEEKEIQLIKENKKWTLKVYGVIAAVVLAIIGVIGLIFGKVVEATLFEEIAKWVVMGCAVALVVCCVLYVPVTMLSDARRKFYPEYGRKWFKHALKVAFGKEK